ncbi:MAG TPA: PQQ-dependent sugar dehydrogenase, partial [Bryobacteraceae bacterium]|nr:PQQ-dependent sugar dehydrogenase [Bryobacteraceae bacterium]
MVFRLNPDGTAPVDNPFFAVGSSMGGEVGDNLKLVFAYGLRNSFGMAFEPRTGLPWITQHGDDTFDEINRVFPGMNGGWVQVMGPLERIAQFKEIETTFFLPPEPFPSLQQSRWPPSQIVNTPREALARMFMLPGP